MAFVAPTFLGKKDRAEAVLFGSAATCALRAAGSAAAGAADVAAAGALRLVAAVVTQWGGCVANRGLGVGCRHGRGFADSR